ncbi:hypothetical protein DQ384_35105 [Sphaerisporangium album]|uniref:Transposase n=1 Tax=Sphaerisporangium album TaxID=509200 RepID=A0A367F046_9ACTN|nr:hypothetical protein [Sphaerisporangium album]RCG22820.1 hypothetical protein DQ384_35105 [Sphaerisporangium album]
MAYRLPYPDPELQEVLNRNDVARELIANFARSTATLGDLWHHVTAALHDTSVLVAEITRLRAEISKTRLHRANLTAAMRAALSADADGEPDPLSYLRDELADQAGTLAPSSPDGGA